MERERLTDSDPVAQEIERLERESQVDHWTCCKFKASSCATAGRISEFASLAKRLAAENDRLQRLACKEYGGECDWISFAGEQETARITAEKERDEARRTHDEHCTVWKDAGKTLGTCTPPWRPR